jgi:hypothetical protein
MIRNLYRVTWVETDNGQKVRMSTNVWAVDDTEAVLKTVPKVEYVAALTSIDDVTTTLIREGK